MWPNINEFDGINILNPCCLKNTLTVHLIFVVGMNFSTCSLQWRRFRLLFSHRVWDKPHLLNQLDKGLTAHCKLRWAWDRNLHGRRCAIQDNRSWSSHRCHIQAGPVEAVTVMQDCVMVARALAQPLALDARAARAAKGIFRET